GKFAVFVVLPRPPPAGTLLPLDQREEMAMPDGKIALYASVGNELTQYDVDVAGASLTRRGTVGLPANVQYAWPHASQPFLYVATSDSASGMGAAGSNHHVTAL